jgi:hypothetical protein
VRKVNEVYKLHPDTEADVKKIIEAFKKSGLEYLEFASHMGISYALVWGVFHNQQPASLHFRSKAQEVLDIDLGVPKGLPKTIGRAPRKPPFQRKFTCPFCHLGEFSIFKARSKFRGTCAKCNARITFAEELEQLSRSQTIELILKKGSGPFFTLEEEQNRRSHSQQTGTWTEEQEKRYQQRLRKERYRRSKS